MVEHWVVWTEFLMAARRAHHWAERSVESSGYKRAGTTADSKAVTMAARWDHPSAALWAARKAV